MVASGVDVNKNAWDVDQNIKIPQKATKMHFSGSKADGQLEWPSSYKNSLSSPVNDP